MIATRYDGYKHSDNMLPFVLNTDLERTPLKYSREKNWHEDLELQFCEGGSGWVLLNGEKKSFEVGDVIVVNPNVIHYTGTDERLVYSCLIIDPDLLKQVGINYDELTFTELLREPSLNQAFKELKEIYLQKSYPFKITLLYSVLLKILVELSSHCERNTVTATQGKAFENVKATIRYIRENYASKISLDDLSRALRADKYTLCRDFKRIAGQTIVEYTNRYRTQKAADFISDGYTVAEAARACGFENLSFFTKTFKKNIGVLPSSYKKK